MSVFWNSQRQCWAYDFWLGGERFRDYCRDDKTGEPIRDRNAKRRAQAAETRVRAKALDGRPREVHRGEYTLTMAQAAEVKRATESRRTPEHVANLRLWGDEALRYFGPHKPFAELTQADLDAYAVEVFDGVVRKWIGGNRRPSLEEYRDPELWRDTGRRRSKRQGNNYMRHLGKLLAIAGKVVDPLSRRPVLSQVPPLEIRLERVPKRKPRPMPDEELDKRLATLPPWRQDQANLSRFYGLRADECLRVELRHIEGDTRPAIFFRGEEAKSGHDERAHSGPAGWALVRRLVRQAKARGVTFLITWPAPHDGVAWYPVWRDGGKVPAAAWQPLKGMGSAWRRSAKRAELGQPHRYHDVRARYITEVAKTNNAAAKGAARHQSAATTELYIGVADQEVAEAVAAAMGRRRPAGRRGKLKVVGG